MIGTVHLKQGDLEAAEATFLRACALTPDDPEPYVNAGRRYTMVHMFPKAEAYFRDALQRAPDDADVYLSIGDAYVHVGELGKARKYFRKAIRLRAKDARIPVGVAVHLIDSGYAREAIPYLLKARAIAPDMPEVYYFLGYAYFRDDREDQAKGELRKARELARNTGDTGLLEGIDALEHMMMNPFFPFGDRGPLPWAFTDDET